MTPGPTHRGDHPLPHQSRLLGRDLAGEGYAQRPQPLLVYAPTERERQRWGTPYRYLVHTEEAISHTAFYDAGELLAWCRVQIASFKCPKTVDVVAELPRNPTGKILKRELRETDTD